MRIVISEELLLRACENSEGAFLRAKDLDIRGALEDGWYALLRGTLVGLVPDSELREKARALADAGEPLPYFDTP